MDTDKKPDEQYINYAPAEDLAEKLYQEHLQNRTHENWLDSNLLLQIEEAEITCPYCNEVFKFEIPTKHLKEHRKKAWIVRGEEYWVTAADPFWTMLCNLYGIRLKDVMYHWSDPDNEELIPDDYVVQYQVYHPVQSLSSSRYYTATPSQNRKGKRGYSPLVLDDGTIHLTGWTRPKTKRGRRRRRCYGGIPKFWSTFATLDIDIYKVKTGSKEHLDIGVKYFKTAQEILNELGLEAIFIYSGNKGFHITTYFDRAISIAFTDRLLKWVKAQLPQRENVNVEMRPEGTATPLGTAYNIAGIRMPLGHHAETGNALVFLQEDGEPLSGQYTYLRALTKSRNAVDGLLAKIKALPEIKESDRKAVSLPDDPALKSQMLEEIIDNLLWIADNYPEYIYPNEELYEKNIEAYYKEQGKKPEKPVVDEKPTPPSEKLIVDVDDLPELTDYGTRHDTALRIALRLRGQGMNEEEIFKMLVEWSQRDDVSSFITSSPVEHIKDFEYIARDVCKYLPPKRKLTHLLYTKADAEYVDSLDIGKVEKAIICYAIGMIRGRNYHNGYVYFSNSMLNLLVGVKSKHKHKKIKQALNVLKTKGLMMEAEKGGLDKETGELRSTKYQVKLEIPRDDGSDLLSIEHKPESTQNKDLWQTVYAKFLGKKSQAMIKGNRIRWKHRD